MEPARIVGYETTTPNGHDQAEDASGQSWFESSSPLWASPNTEPSGSTVAGSTAYTRFTLAG